MQWRNYSSRPAMLAILVLALLFGLSRNVLSLPERIDLSGGGVIDDIQTLEVGSDDIVWAASMGTGLFRVKWESSSWDHTWSENLAGKGVFGLDAIYQSSTEYVLAGTACNGIYFSSSSSGSFANWIRPNNEQQQYPSTWNNIRAHDLAFYCNTNGSYETNPEDKYFVIYRNNDLPGGPGGYLGIYKWNDGTPAFDRITSALDRQFDHFYRDKKDPNVLYVKGEDAVSGGDVKYLYRLKGDYASLEFVDKDFARHADPNDQDYTLDVYAFNQWKYDENNTYSYALIKWHDVSANHDYISVFAWLNLHSATTGACNLVYTPPSAFASNLSSRDEIYEPGMEAEVVGKAVAEISQTYHHLWLSAGKYGVWFFNDQTNQVYVLNGTSTINQEPELKNWSPRSMVPDIQDHISTGTGMRLFYGSHFMGVWWLDFTEAEL